MIGPHGYFVPLRGTSCRRPDEEPIGAIAGLARCHGSQHAQPACWAFLQPPSSLQRRAMPPTRSPTPSTFNQPAKTALDAALHDSALLVSLRQTAPAGGFALVARAKGDIGRLQTALHSFGYYQGQATIEIAGHKLDDPELHPCNCWKICSQTTSVSAEDRNHARSEILSAPHFPRRRCSR